MVCAYRAILTTRTAQGAVAWAVSLVLLPYLSVPLYLVFGRRKFRGYMRARRTGETKLDSLGLELRKFEEEFRSQLPDPENRLRAMESLAKMPFTSSNDVELLVDGKEIFPSILDGIDAAEDYVLVQFYIVRDDELGRDFQSKLIAKASAGVRVYFLYDEIGCYQLPGKYLDELSRAGVHVHSFLTTRGPNNRFQINFRNHRKVVIVDGRTAWVGGVNIGDEYLGRDAKVGEWRDTNLRVEGPVVQCVQLSFLEDWFFAVRGIPEMNWKPQRSAKGTMDVLSLATGPADMVESASLFFVHTINRAQSRLWIASPYFVPDESVVSALQIAALRGVDVRILLPEKADHLLVYLSSFSYLEDLEGYGIKIYRYQPGFLHQKALLADDDLSVVGTANLDNRSFRLNFELTMVVASKSFAAEMEAMFEADFARSDGIGVEQLAKRSRWFQFAVKLSRLTAPVQ
ncbi:UNVERIFIED_CONTAM: hypothetical protein GTU68_026433 [Idotea baltica]|nr:hypothetical protein [Idotea baltica]